MANRNLKMTGIGRFIIFLLLVAPIIYVGASYYTGQDGIQNLKNIFQSSSSEPVTHTPQPESDVLVNSELARLKDELAAKEQRNKALYLENEQLKKELSDSKEELKAVKNQLEKIKTAIN